MPRPIARLIMVKVTGKVKLIAVSSAVPRRLTKKVSTRLKVNIMNMPIIIGMVIRTSAALIDPSTRLGFGVGLGEGMELAGLGVGDCVGIAYYLNAVCLPTLTFWRV